MPVVSVWKTPRRPRRRAAEALHGGCMSDDHVEAEQPDDEVLTPEGRHLVLSLADGVGADEEVG